MWEDELGDESAGRGSVKGLRLRSQVACVNG